MHLRDTPPGPYIGTTCRERELPLDHIYTWLTTQGHGEPPRISDQLNARATSETKRTLKRINIIHSLIHSNKTDMIRMIMMAKWYLSNHVGLKLSDICLIKARKSSEKNLTQETCPDRGSNRARCVTGAHSTSCSAAVDEVKSQNYIFLLVFIFFEIQ